MELPARSRFGLAVHTTQSINAKLPNPMKRLILLVIFGLPLGASAQSEVFFRQPVADRSIVGLTTGELTLVQSGQLNQLQFKENGRANAVILSQQGENNTLEVDIVGSENRYLFAQQGDNNAALWRSHQNNGQLEVLQRGNNNQLVQDGSSPAPGVPMRIEQTGGMQLILKNNF